MTLGPVRVMGAGVVVMMCVEEVILMLNKNTAKKARPIRSSSYLTTSLYIAILAAKNFDIKVRPRIS